MSTITHRSRMSGLALLAASTFAAGVSVVASPVPAQAEEPLTHAQLLADCDGTGVAHPEIGTGYAGYLDACTYEEQEQWTEWEWEDTGDTVTNCTPGVISPIDHTTSGTETWTTGWSVNTYVGKEWKWLTVTAGYNETHSTSVTNSNTIHVEPGRKGSLTVGAEVDHSSGRIRVNYSTPVNGHYVWYIDGVHRQDPTGAEQVGQEDKPCSETLLNGQ